MSLVYTFIVVRQAEIFVFLLLLQKKGRKVLLNLQKGKHFISAEKNLEDGNKTVNKRKRVEKNE